MVAQRIKLNNYSYLFIILTLSLFSSYCGIARSPKYDYSKDYLKTSKIREKIVSDAQSFLGRKYIKIDGKYFNSDCSGLVNAVYYKNGFDLIGNAPTKNNLVRLIYSNVETKGNVYRNRAPNPGDIVFFSHTYRKFGTNRFSHAGIVEEIRNDGTVSFIHQTSQGIKRDYVNLDSPSAIKSKDGKILNSYLRRRSKYDTSNVKYLAGELFESYGSVID